MTRVCRTPGEPAKAREPAGERGSFAIVTERPFRILGVQQIAVGAPDKGELRRLWVDLLGLRLHGSYRSERPEPYVTDVHEHADDAAALLDALAAAPAVVIGRSYGGATAIDLALRYPRHVRALVLLEGDAPSLSETAAEWLAFALCLALAAGIFALRRQRRGHLERREA